MQYRPLGSTGIDISALSFGAGPVPAAMTGDDTRHQRDVVARALELGINWFDTAATYGEGRSEESLGRALRELRATEQLHVATKVRLFPDQLDEIEKYVRASLEGSLRRLGLERVTLLQLHNSITAGRGDEPTSLTPGDVLNAGGVLSVMQKLQEEGKVQHLGLTGIGQADPLHEVVDSGQFASIQIPYSLVNPSAGQVMPDGFPEANYGNVIELCARHRMGVLAIRVFAGGALVGAPPSDHTHKTKFFPLPLYRRDLRRAEMLSQCLPPEMDVKQAALRYVMSRQDISSAIVGFGEAEHVDEAVRILNRGPLEAELLERITRGEHLHLDCCD